MNWVIHTALLLGICACSLACTESREIHSHDHQDGKIDDSIANADKANPLGLQRADNARAVRMATKKPVITAAMMPFLMSIVKAKVAALQAAKAAGSTGTAGIRQDAPPPADNSAALLSLLTAAMQAKPAAGAVAGTGTATATGLENGAEKEGGGSSS